LLIEQFGEPAGHQERMAARAANELLAPGTDQDAHVDHQRFANSWLRQSLANLLAHANLYGHIPARSNPRLSWHH
jgi:hypothetical protein